MKYDYSKDTMTIDGETYPLRPYRKWIYANHEQLVVAHFVRSIMTVNGPKKAYDWQTIYFVSEQYFLQDYLKTLK